MTFRVRMPDVDRRVGNRLAVHGDDLRRDEQRIARHACRNVGAVRLRRGPFNMERAEDRLLGRLGRALMILRNHQLRETERVREENELLPLIRAHVPGTCEERDPLEPLVLGQIDLTGKLMQMPHERRHDLL